MNTSTAAFVNQKEATNENQNEITFFSRRHPGCGAAFGADAAATYTSMRLLPGKDARKYNDGEKLGVKD